MTDRAETDRRRLGGVLLIVVLAYLGLNLRAAWPFTTDDAFITLRYARHLVDGVGLLWNPGEPPVEGYSNFSYLLIAAGALRLGIDPVVVLKLVGAASALAATGLLYALARLWLPPTAAVAAPLAFSLLSGVSWWAVSGLETTFYVATSLAAILLLFRAWETRRAAALAGAGLVAVVPAITRPEGVLVAGCLGVYGLLAQRRAMAAGSGRSSLAALRPVAIYGLAFAVPFGLYQAWRLAYYSRLLPNSAYCKLVSADEMQLLLEYLEIGWPLVGLSVLALVARRPRDLRFAPLVMIGLVYAGLVRDVVPVVAYHHRHVLLGLAVWCVPAAVGLEEAVRRVRRSSPRPALGEGLRLAALAAVAIGLIAVEGTVPSTIRDRAQRMTDRIQVRESIADWLAGRLAPDDLVATPDAGVVPYRLVNPVLDTMCLNCRAATRPPISRRPGPYAAYILRARPRFIVAYVGDSGRFRSGAALELVHLTREFAERYRRVAFFDTAVEDFNFAVYERLTDGPEAPQPP